MLQRHRTNTGKHGNRTQLPTGSALFSKQAVCPADAYFPKFVEQDGGRLERHALAGANCLPNRPCNPYTFTIRRQGRRRHRTSRPYQERPRFRDGFRSRPVTFHALSLLRTGPTGLEPAVSSSTGKRISRYATTPQSKRKTGFEPATSCAAGRHSTVELLPHTSCPWSDSNAHCHASETCPSTGLGYKGVYPAYLRLGHNSFPRGSIPVLIYKTRLRGFRMQSTKVDFAFQNGVSTPESRPMGY